MIQLVDCSVWHSGIYIGCRFFLKTRLVSCREVVNFRTRILAVCYRKNQLLLSRYELFKIITISSVVCYNFLLKIIMLLLCLLRFAVTGNNTNTLNFHFYISHCSHFFYLYLYRDFYVSYFHSFFFNKFLDKMRYT